MANPNTSRTVSTSLPSPVLVIDSTPEMRDNLQQMDLQVHRLQSGLADVPSTPPANPYQLIIYDPQEVKMDFQKDTRGRNLMWGLRSLIKAGAVCIVFLNEINHDSSSSPNPSVPNCAYDSLLTLGERGDQTISTCGWRMATTMTYSLGDPMAPKVRSFQTEICVDIAESADTQLSDIVYHSPWIESLLATKERPLFGKPVRGDTSSLIVNTHPLTGGINTRVRPKPTDEIMDNVGGAYRDISIEVTVTPLAIASNGQPFAFCVSQGKGLILVLPQAGEGNARYLEGINANWPNIVAPLQKPKEKEPPPPEGSTAEVFVIDSSQFNEGKTFGLLGRIVLDVSRKGVALENGETKRTFDSLKERLREKGYDKVASSLEWNDGKPKTTIPFGQITITQKK